MDRDAVKGTKTSTEMAQWGGSLLVSFHDIFAVLSEERAENSRSQQSVPGEECRGEGGGRRLEVGIS